MLHRNVCPESVIINKAGAWKLAGFEFCQANTAPADQSVRRPRELWCMTAATSRRRSSDVWLYPTTPVIPFHLRLDLTSFAMQP